PLLLAFGAFYLEKVRVPRGWIKYAAFPFILLTGIPLLPVLLPVWEPRRLATYYKATGLDKTGILEWEDQQDHDLPQDYADMLGWKEVTRKTVDAYKKIPAGDRKSTIIIGS